MMEMLRRRNSHSKKHSVTSSVGITDSGRSRANSLTHKAATDRIESTSKLLSRKSSIPVSRRTSADKMSESTMKFMVSNSQPSMSLTGRVNSRTIGRREMAQ